MFINNGIIPTPERIIVYGPEGIGKSTIASNFPNPLFIDVENSTSELNVARFDTIPKDWSSFVEMVLYVKEHPDICDTLVIDSLDWTEKLCIKHICESSGKESIGDFAYGAGYTRLADEIQKMLSVLSEITECGIHIVMTAHSMIRKFERPEESGAYDRFELKLEKKTAPLYKEWATMLLFCDYETNVVLDSNNKAKARGGDRVIHTCHHPCWDAKNRKNMPEKLPLSYDSLAPYIYNSNKNHMEVNND
ncbi:MAG: ATP-binding protein [Mogibacterium sp.]|nr:ATP-binding protein [Mogibacterium sp.]